MRLVGFASLVLAVGFLAAAKVRYTVQSADERGPFAPTLVYGVLGAVFALAALALIPGER